MSVWILALIIFAIASVMTMTGRGGGNFYVLALVLSGIGMHEAATTGQFILIVSSLAATILFGKQKITDWKLVFLIGSMTLVSAFLGGLFSDIFQDKLLKIIFAIFITIASVMMLKPVNKQVNTEGRFSFTLNSGNESYSINLLIVVPIVLLTGFVSGMVGISGGSFLVPLMILAIRVPMHIAVGTSTTLVLVTATAGFLGHLSSGHFDYRLALPLALAGLIGGIIGAKLTLKFKPKKLKIVFALTSIIAAILMIINAY
ncbi:MAG: sulfite exporter TauE/SafE family protein [Salinivirgaceae bacterium]|nr:sulfite exporter TauE/SafE family protein [Salinivirgaceae bacterium]